jgi:aryl-alcohol dehydrogenase-like predicted oxidoreductase
VNRIILGTAQFGFDYGVNNSRGRIPESEAHAILDCALENGVDLLDTAPVYGESETVIGRFMERRGARFRIISKLPGEAMDDPIAAVRASLSRLQVISLEGCLIHDFTAFMNRSDRREILTRLRGEGLAARIGFSLYHPRELDRLVREEIEFDLVQIPFSVFDQRFAPSLRSLKRSGRPGIEVHARSVFLQGLFFRNPDELAPHFLPLAPKLKALHRLAAEAGIPLQAVCLNFALLNPDLDQVLLGVDNLEHFRKNLEHARWEDAVQSLLSRLAKLKEGDESMILPTEWPRVA